MKKPTIDIAVGTSAKSKTWKNYKWEWSKIVKKLSETHHTYETFKEFMSASKDEQLKIKDAGGYVGGYLLKGRRKPENVLHRQLLTLDIDFAHKDFWSDFTLMYGNAAVLHGTHKHTEASPRYRLVMPLSRECTPDEYVAVSRHVAGALDIELFDNTTFETNRLMFWPTTAKDQEYYFKEQSGEWVDVDTILNSYTDWTDSSSWPTSQTHFEEVRIATDKQEDPENKKGIIGAFCKAYTITECIENFLTEVYTPAGEERFTYVNGTTAAGLIVYEDKFAFSHHGTDPCGGKLCNAFDLVRIHKFGHLDETRDNSSKAKSFKAMQEFCTKDKGAKKILAVERLENAQIDFDAEESNWVTDLEVDGRGAYLSTATNLNLIFENDPRLSRAFKENKFDNKKYVVKNLPWRGLHQPEPIKNVDYSGVRNYLESIYGITGVVKIEDALNLEFDKNSFHPIKEYLDGLEWDGEERIDTLLIEYFGVDDNVYTREAIRKALVAGVARIYRPGTKFDLVLTLVGDQGTGKSTFVNRLGGQWFSDTFTTVHGKEAFEQVQGAWLIEIAELSGLRKAEVETIKHFISKQEDTFRPAYARTSESYKRQCIFFGTTNNKDFLRDPSGNRRFMPIDVRIERAIKSVFDKDFPVDEIWAEAVYLYEQGEKLYLSKEAERIAKIEQNAHSEVDDRTGIILEYLDKKLPKNWDDKDLGERRLFLEDTLSEKGKVFRDTVCVAEIWCECLGQDKNAMTRYNTRNINDIMRSLLDWEGSNSTKNFPIYGKQKYYTRKLY